MNRSLELSFEEEFGLIEELAKPRTRSECYSLPSRPKISFLPKADIFFYQQAEPIPYPHPDMIHVGEFGVAQIMTPQNIYQINGIKKVVYGILRKNLFFQTAEKEIVSLFYESTHQRVCVCESERSGIQYYPLSTPLYKNIYDGTLIIIEGNLFGSLQPSS